MRTYSIKLQLRLLLRAAKFERHDQAAIDKMNEHTNTLTRAKRSSRRGAAAVEFALVAPIIFIMIFASIEFARAIMAIDGMEESVREGCRLSVLDDTTTQEIEDMVEQRMNLIGISSYTLTITPDPPSTACQWDPVTVMVSTPFSNVSLLPAPRFIGNITLNASCTLPREGNPCGTASGSTLN